MEEIIRQKIEGISNSFFPIKEQANKYLNNNSQILNDQTIRISHRPWIAPMNWGIILYPKANSNWLDTFRKKTNKRIPKFYNEFLREINGCFIYDLSLYGLTPSIYTEGLINRTLLQCHDITTANNYWATEYEIENNLFHFGRRVYNSEENVGYFSDNKEKIFSILKDGNVISTWSTFSQFLKDEIQVSEMMMLEELPNDINLRENKN